MATIGTFTATDDGFTGTLATLNIKAKVRITRVQKDSEKAPDARVYAGTTELGAAWSKTSREDRPYMAVKLDDPSFPAPIYANLVEGDGRTSSSPANISGPRTPALRVSFRPQPEPTPNSTPSIQRWNFIQCPSSIITVSGRQTVE